MNAGESEDRTRADAPPLPSLTGEDAAKPVLRCGQVSLVSGCIAAAFLLLFHPLVWARLERLSDLDPLHGSSFVILFMLFVIAAMTLGIVGMKTRAGRAGLTLGLVSVLCFVFRSVSGL